MEELNIKQNVSKGNPFSVPEGYFEQLAGSILSRLPERQEVKKRPKSPLRRLYRPLIGVAASVCIAIFGVSIYLHNTHSKPVADTANSSEVSVDVIYSSDDAADYIMLDNDDIYLYLCELDMQ